MNDNFLNENFFFSLNLINLSMIAWQKLLPAFAKSLRLGVNFINILRPNFLSIFWRQTISNPKHSFAIFGAKLLSKNLLVKCWWNWPLERFFRALTSNMENIFICTLRWLEVSIYFERTHFERKLLGITSTLGSNSNCFCAYFDCRSTTCGFVY